jgi:hypothetical protein
MAFFLFGAYPVQSDGLGKWNSQISAADDDLPGLYRGQYLFILARAL